MIYPSIDKLLNKVGSKYLLVNLVAKRSKEMQESKNYQMKEEEYTSSKDIGKALEEIACDLMNINDYNYDLPEKFIAQTPIKNRSESKLMVLNKETGEIKHGKFFDILNLLNKDDVLVLNNTKVLPARLFGIKKETGAKIEILLLKNGIQISPHDILAIKPLKCWR